MVGLESITNDDVGVGSDPFEVSTCACETSGETTSTSEDVNEGSNADLGCDAVSVLNCQRSTKVSVANIDARSILQ